MATAQSVYTPYQIATYAGTATYGSIDGSAQAARFASPMAVAVDAGGDLYVADYDNSTIRKITPAGTVTTFAGTAGSTGAADGTGAAASFNHPLGLTADASGNIYVADTVNRAIRMITPAAVVTTVAVNATLQSPRGVAADPVGNLYVTDETVVRKIAPGGAVTALASGFTEATGIALDSQGNVYVTDYASSSNSVCKIATDGTVTTVAAGLIYAFGVAVDAAGNLYVSCAGNDGTAVVGTSNTIQRISPGGVATVLAGSGGVIGSDDGFGVAAQFGDARGIALDGSGDLLRHFFDLRPAR